MDSGTIRPYKQVISSVLSFHVTQKPFLLAIVGKKNMRIISWCWFALKGTLKFFLVISSIDRLLPQPPQQPTLQKRFSTWTCLWFHTLAWKTTSAKIWLWKEPIFSGTLFIVRCYRVSFDTGCPSFLLPRIAFSSIWWKMSPIYLCELVLPSREEDQLGKEFLPPEIFRRTI